MKLLLDSGADIDAVDMVCAVLPTSCVVWCGVVWSGAVWCDMVWCNAVWCSIVRCCPKAFVVSCNTVSLSVVAATVSL